MAVYLGSNKVEIGTSSGGGSSDFTTATVTVTNDYHSAVDLRQCICCINEGELGEGSPAIVSDIDAAFGPLEPDTTATYTVPLYKGSCLWRITADETISTTGDVMNNRPMYLITGNCTITFS